MLVIPEEHWAKALKLLYTEKFDWSRLVYDITYTSIGAAAVSYTHLVGRIRQQQKGAGLPVA